MKDATGLVNGLIAKEAAAQHRFWATFWNKTLPICNRILGVGPDATDAAVDLMTDFASHHVHHLKNPEAIGAYLRLMAIRQSLDLKKRQQKMVSLDEDLLDLDGESPDVEAEAALLKSRLPQCLEQLTKKARQCLRLKYAKELTNEQIGVLLGGSKQYIGRLIRKSLEALKACLEKKQRRLRPVPGGSMADKSSTALSIELVESMLSTRPKVDLTGHAPYLAKMALVVAGVADDQTIQEVDRHLATCTACREVLLAEHGESVVIEPTEKRSTASRLYPMAAAALILLGLALYALLPKQESPKAALHLKGLEDNITAAVRRGNETVTVAPMDRLSEGDRLGLFYSAKRDGYLLVFNVDSTHHVALLHPFGKPQSGPFRWGMRSPFRTARWWKKGSGASGSFRFFLIRL